MQARPGNKVACKNMDWTGIGKFKAER